ncbi:MAG TPA: metallophosphoesterase [Nocardioidaceae bacterium]|nr:metallophosphoesterase [Nocardioidaceae bacterium]
MLRRVALLLVAWLVVAAPSGIVVALNSSEQTVLAGHEVTVRPTLDGWATFDLGPYLPEFRHPSTGRVGAAIDVGKTTAGDYDVLLERYAVIAARPDSQIHKLREVVTGMLLRGAFAGALIGLVAPLGILLVGRRRWDELATRTTIRRAVILGLVVAITSYGLYRVFPSEEGPQVAEERWRPLEDALPDLTIPEEAELLQIDSSLLTRGSEQLVESLVGSYRASLVFYEDLEQLASTIGPQLHQPAEDETVALLVADRHDNINMDPVAREVAEQGGATILLDAGDDTSTGSSWEAFSLESLDEAFDDFEHRYGVAGNHDHGDFVVRTLQDFGFTMLVGEPVEGPAGIRFLGASDPRSSGLGSWVDEKEISFAEQTTRIADLACSEDEAGRRVATLLVHDVGSAAEALDRGCVDLALGGHRHEQIGPEAHEGANGQVGYLYINGTTGGAAYAIALGSKLRRNAQVTLVTYRDGRPVGLQAVTFRTVKDIVVAPYVELELREPEVRETARPPRTSEGAGRVWRRRGDLNPRQGLT